VSTPRISVVVPSYNQAPFLELTLKSILDKNYPNLELIVMDGGSTDGSVEILKKYSDRIAYWVSERDGGQTPALVKGFSRSTGEIQCWLNSDDLFMPGALAEVGEYFAANPKVDAVFGDTIWIDVNGTELRHQREIPFNRFIWMHTYNYIPGMSMFWRRSVYENVGGLDTKFNLAMDADLWARISEVGRIHHARRTWSKMRFYPEQKNVRLRERSDQEDIMIRSRYIDTTDGLSLKVKRAVAYAWRGAWRLLSGCYSQGYERQLKAPKSVVVS